MADAAARREARKRKILENSDSRLQRITGQGSSSESPEEEQRVFRPETVFSTFPSQNPNSFLNPENFGNVPLTRTPEIDHQEFERRFQQLQNEIFSGMDALTGGSQRRNLDGENIPSLPGNGNIGGNFDPEMNPSEILNFLSQAKGAPKKPVDTPLRAFLSGPWVYILLAAAANIMIILKMEHLYGSSILIPFLVILASRVAFCREAQDPLGNLFTGALILCNIRPQLIYPLKTALKISSRFFKEISLYVFSFVIIYYFSSRFWLDIDELVPNKAEIIIDHSKEL